MESKTKKPTREARGEENSIFHPPQLCLKDLENYFILKKLNPSIKHPLNHVWASGWKRMTQSTRRLGCSSACTGPVAQSACSPESSSSGNQRHCCLPTGRRQAIRRSVSSPSPDTASAISHITRSHPCCPSSVLGPSRRRSSSPRRRSPSSPAKIRRLAAGTFFG
jgi:hypothetical protein